METESTFVEVEATGILNKFESDAIKNVVKALYRQFPQATSHEICAIYPLQDGWKMTVAIG